MGKDKEGLSARYIEEAVEASLKRLQTDVIDLYLSHFPDMATPVSETLGAYQKLIEKGKIRWCSASNLTISLLDAAIAEAKAHELPRYEVLQPVAVGTAITCLLAAQIPACGFPAPGSSLG